MSLPLGIPFTSPLCWPQSLDRNGNASGNPTRGELTTENRSNLSYLFLVFVIAIYFVGVVFGVVWVATRDYNRQDGPPWVPRFCRNEVCCVCFEPIAHFWPAFLWPLFLILVLICCLIDKAPHATTCCGLETRRRKRRKWLQATGMKTRDTYDSEFGPEPLETTCPRLSVISIPPCPVPRAIYATHNPALNMNSWSPSSPSSPLRTNSGDSLDRLGKSRWKSTGSWISTPGRGDRSPTLPPYQPRSNSAQNLGPVGIYGYNSVGSVSPLGQTRASPAPTPLASPTDPAPNPEAHRPISIQIKRILILERRPSPLQRSELVEDIESVEDIAPQVVMQTGGSPEHGGEAEDPKLNSSGGSERAASNNEGVERQ